MFKDFIPKLVRIQNTTKGVVLVDSVDVANTSATRRTGLLKHTSLLPGQGMLIVPCEGIHTWGMKFDIDVVFLSKELKIVGIRKNMGRRRIAFCLWAHSVLELPAGMLDTTGTQKGDQLRFDR